jgi:hypothetical protein
MGTPADVTGIAEAGVGCVWACARDDDAPIMQTIAAPTAPLAREIMASV